jgi:hypothetical protein
MITNAPRVDSTKKPPPSYFESIRTRAHNRWSQLEADQELAGPWWQLFNQVQSPRHVFSELLQNADDAGATFAKVEIIKGNFIFCHNGHDFDESEFSSLCRFAFSNKRSLHTVGFRGIGFKSVFSLGDPVRVATPTLGIGFFRGRFTEPIWTGETNEGGLTEISVRIADENRCQEVQKNLNEWAESPVSLLFFNNLRELTIGAQTIKRSSRSSGPVPHSEWVKLEGRNSHEVLVLRSTDEEFPEEAKDEIRKERNLSDLNLPPCGVEIVLGLPAYQRLYVVLPTDVKLDLPFSCNAPFLQDPARAKVKEPSISPTNRWLLQRLGRLAGASLLNWLCNEALSVAERVNAYKLLGQPLGEHDDVESQCSIMIQRRMMSMVQERPILLTTSGPLAKANSVLAPPYQLYAVWPSEELNSFLGDDTHQILAEEVDPVSRGTLKSWNWISILENVQVIERLSSGHRPTRPCSWKRLLRLWSFILDAIKIYHDPNGQKLRSMRMLPVNGHDGLFAATDVVRLSTRIELLSKEDWMFLTTGLNILESQWLDFLHEAADIVGEERVDAMVALQLIKSLGLDGPTLANVLVEQASLRVFCSKEVPVRDCIRLAHIAAALNANTPYSFKYFTRDNSLRGLGHNVLSGPANIFAELLPEDWGNAHLLHDDYSVNFSTCTSRQWDDWCRSNKSGLLSFVRPIPRRENFGYRSGIVRILKARQVEGPVDFPYQNGTCIFDDFDFPQILLDHWERLTEPDPCIWGRILQILLLCPPRVWQEAIYARAQQNWGIHHRSVHCSAIPAAWISRFRSLKCLPDTFGNYHVPAEIYLRNPSTEPLIGVEPFVLADLDTENTKPLLRLLGVRDTPFGIEKLIDRIKALATSQQPLSLIHEIAKWYEALDHIMTRASTDVLQQARAAFQAERLIITEKGEWVTGKEAFQNADEQDVPDAPVVHSSVRSLSIWTKLGVSERPSAELVLNWLSGLESCARLDGQILKRVTNALRRYPIQIWTSCEHWLNLDGGWVPTSTLSFRLTMQALAKYGDLFPRFKEITGDFKMLSAEICQQTPFSSIPNLGDKTEYRLTQLLSDLPQSVDKPWMRELARLLVRVKLEKEAQTNHVRQVAARLYDTVWQPFQGLKVTPYLDGVPAGEPHSLDVLWYETKLLVRDKKPVRLFNLVIQEMGGAFDNSDVLEACKCCFERDPEFVAEYIEEHFDLDEESPEMRQGLGLDTEQREGGASVVPSRLTDTAEGASHDNRSEDADAALIEIAKANMPPRMTRGPKPHEVSDDPSLIALFAAQKGFRWDDMQRRYVHENGDWMERVDGCFNWVCHNSAGEVIGRYWLSSQSILSGSLEVGADLWELIKKNPQGTAIVVGGTDNRPRELNGSELLKLQGEGRVSLFPFKYRLRWNAEY